MPDSGAGQYLPEWVWKAAEWVGIGWATIAARRSHLSAQSSKDSADKAAEVIQMQTVLSDHEKRIATLERTVVRNHQELISEMGAMETRLCATIERAARRTI